MKKLMVVLVAMAIVVAMAGMAIAGDTEDVNVRAQIVGTCQINSHVDVDFGVLDQTLSSDKTASGSVQFWCTKNAAYVLGDETNPNVGDGSFSGTMTDGTDTIAYTLAYDNFSGMGLGKTSPITSTITGTVLNANYVNVEAGNYADVVTFTITP